MIAHTVLHLSAQRMPNLEIRKSYLARVHTHPVTNVTCSNFLSLSWALWKHKVETCGSKPL